jgi:hypothetical protein
MKTAYLLIIICFSAKVCDAQQRPTVVLNKNFADTIFNHPKAKMPNALKQNDPNLSMKFKGNNQQGFDIYESPLDKMPIISPDSANKSSLGMKNKAIIFTPQYFDYSQIPLTRPFDDSLFIPDFNINPFDSNKKRRKN